MKKYAITTSSAFGTLWYYEEDLPEEWWTSKKHKAMLFNSVKGAEAKALWIVGQHPEMLGNVALFEGDEIEFGRKPIGKGAPGKGPAGTILGEMFDALFGGDDRGRLRGSEEAPAQDRPKEGEGGAPPESRNPRRSS